MKPRQLELRNQNSYHFTKEHLIVFCDYMKNCDFYHENQNLQVILNKNDIL